MLRRRFIDKSSLCRVRGKRSCAKLHSPYNETSNALKIAREVEVGWVERAKSAGKLKKEQLPQALPRVSQGRAGGKNTFVRSDLPFGYALFGGGMQP